MVAEDGALVVVGNPVVCEPDGVDAVVAVVALGDALLHLPPMQDEISARLVADFLATRDVTFYPARHAARVEPRYSPRETVPDYERVSHCYWHCTWSASSLGGVGDVRGHEHPPPLARLAYFGVRVRCTG